jgi:hypothetical protein
MPNVISGAIFLVACAPDADSGRNAAHATAKHLLTHFIAAPYFYV